MNPLLIFSNVARRAVMIRSSKRIKNTVIRDNAGKKVNAPLIKQTELPTGEILTELDASDLEAWSPSSPTLYVLQADGQCVRFGYGDLRPEADRVLVNGRPFYFRGYIRGIVAHDHPNLSGLPKREFFRKNILQAKKYGFNLVRFHSTIPDEEFVEEADALGLFVHMELGYSYKAEAPGQEKKIEVDEARWRDVIIRFRNHPSVAIFCLGNEMHNSGRIPEVHNLYRIGRDLAPGKLIVDNAGWGEYDRECSDIFTQHIAYYFPYKHHADMFNQDFCWETNGSVYGVPLSGRSEVSSGSCTVVRSLNPVRPVLAHECVHYIDIPDYAALSREFDEFCRRVGPDYLSEHGIRKPRYLTDLPKLIESKKLESKIPDYMLSSQHFKKIALKTYIERLRFSGKICGFELLQLSDCLKYENKNGLLDCFDNDKYMDAGWMRRFNDDTVLLADFPERNFLAGEEFPVAIHLSNYGLSETDDGYELSLYVSSKTGERTRIFHGKHVKPLPGVSKLADLKLRLDASLAGATEYVLEAELFSASGIRINQWNFWVFHVMKADYRPELKVCDPKLRARLESVCTDTPLRKDVVFCDLLDDSVLDDLESGKTVIVNYHHAHDSRQYYLPGTRDRFKPCIWDRGSHLGGVVTSESFQRVMGAGRYFDKNYYNLVEGCYKINLDHFPVRVNEVIWGVDKPVRDRMKGLIHGIKEFLSDDTLRNFSYLFSLSVGPGLLVVCAFNFSRDEQDPAVDAALSFLINQAGSLDTDCSISVPEFRKYLQDLQQKEIRDEDVMNRFWELDNKPVEDQLFWESARIDLSRMKKIH